MKYFFILFCSMFMLGSCVSNIPMPQTQGAYKPEVAPKSNESLVYIYRKSWALGGGGPTLIYINNIEVIRLDNVGYSPVYLKPGCYTFLHSWPSQHGGVQTELEDKCFEGGRTYYLKVKVVTRGKSKLSPIDVTTATNEITKCEKYKPIRSRISSSSIKQKPSPHISLHAFSFKPPERFTWLLAGRSPYQISLARRGQYKDETYAIQGFLLKLDKMKNDETFLNYVKSGISTNPNPERYTVRSGTYDIAKKFNTTCIRFNQSFEDRSAVKRSTNNRSMLLDTAGLICKHPEHKNTYPKVVFSRRHYSEDKHPDFHGMASEVLDSLKFQ